MKLCPNCKTKVLENYGKGEDVKPSADWYCPKCDRSNKDEYVFYDSEVLIFV